MTNEQKARIRWLRPEEGGRISPPPGPNYSTVARFEALEDRWPQEAWSIVLSIAAAADEEGVMMAGIRMLNGAAAPEGLLSQGSRFVLFEGGTRVAVGTVL